MVADSYQVAVNPFIRLNLIVVFPLNVLQTDTAMKRGKGAAVEATEDRLKKKVKMKQKLGKSGKKLRLGGGNKQRLQRECIVSQCFSLRKAKTCECEHLVMLLSNQCV